MSESSEQPEQAPATPPGLEVRTHFVRKRNALVARADFGELYVDYYLHLVEIGRRYAGAGVED